MPVRGDPEDDGDAGARVTTWTEGAYWDPDPPIPRDDPVGLDDAQRNAVAKRLHISREELDRRIALAGPDLDPPDWDDEEDDED